MTIVMVVEWLPFNKFFFNTFRVVSYLSMKAFKIGTMKSIVNFVF